MNYKTTLSTLLAALVIGTTALTQAQQNNDPPPSGCSSWDQVPGTFIEQCLLAGSGTYVQCIGGQANCCKKKKDSQGDEVEHCSTNPSDVARGLKNTGIKTAPGLMAPPTTPIKPIKPIGTAPAPTLNKTPAK